MKKIVQKFGGTSLNSHKKREKAAKKIKYAVKNGFHPIVVVSAMGRYGDAYATDTLINMAEKVCVSIDPREKDLLMSCGEVISAVIIVQHLKSIGIDGVALTGSQAGIETDERFGESTVKEVNPDNILDILKNNKVPVVAGFQGKTSNNEITTLGRGGSDTTASILADAVDALYIEIFTDVDGLMTADPSLVKKAKILDEVTYKEVCELAYQGARVIHPRAAEIARASSIPIKISSLDSNKPGTIIHDSDMRKIAGSRPITGLASRHNIIFVKINPKNSGEYDTGLKIFKKLASKKISVDFINIRPDGISFIVSSEKKVKVLETLKNDKFNYELSEHYVKISIVGGGMTGRPGIMARVVEALTEDDISIFQTTDSHTTISCLISSESEKKALNTLHDAFSLSDF